jgi:hypothetical protein
MAGSWKPVHRKFFLSTLRLLLSPTFSTKLFQYIFRFRTRPDLTRASLTELPAAAYILITTFLQVELSSQHTNSTRRILTAHHDASSISIPSIIQSFSSKFIMFRNKLTPQALPMTSSMQAAPGNPTIPRSRTAGNPAITPTNSVHHHVRTCSSASGLPHR